MVFLSRIAIDNFVEKTMAQRPIKLYVYHKWDSSCSQAEEFLNNLRKGFNEGNYEDEDIISYTTKAIAEYVNEQEVLLNENTMAAMLGVLITTFYTDKLPAKYAAYDAIMNMWPFMDGIYMITYRTLTLPKEKKEYLLWKRREFLNWFSINSMVDVSSYHNILFEVFDVIMIIKFHPEDYSVPVILMSYITIKGDHLKGKWDRRRRNRG